MGAEVKNQDIPVHDMTPRNSGLYGDEAAEKPHVMQIDNIHGHPVSIQWPLDPVVEKKLMRKVDLILVPWLFLLFLLAFLDRVNSTPPHQIQLTDCWQCSHPGPGSRLGNVRQRLQCRSSHLLCPVHFIRDPFQYFHQETETLELAFCYYVCLGNCDHRARTVS
jgi:hypothetical protein